MERRARATVAAAIGLLLPGVAAAAGRFSWFDETPARDTLGQVRLPFSPLNPQARLTFGIDAYQSLSSGALLDDYALTQDPGDRTVIRLYGEFAPRLGDLYSPLTVLNPVAADETPVLGSANSRLSGFGIKWQHRVDAYHTFAVSAGYSEVPWSIEAPHLDALDARAALSWSSKWGGALQPGLTGSFFFGDESVRDEAYQQLGRRYYGFSLGGELRLAQDHTPYFAYRMKRNIYSSDDPAFAMAPQEEYAQFSAGWRWQVQPNWSLQAEATYGLNGAPLDPYSPDRSRFFFGTRFDFR
ncbi:MAG TPA: hypothetical protein VF203_00785 [Burkholderiales bacterium]